MKKRQNLNFFETNEKKLMKLHVFFQNILNVNYFFF